MENKLKPSKPSADFEVFKKNPEQWVREQIAYLTFVTKQVRRLKEMVALAVVGWFLTLLILFFK